MKKFKSRMRMIWSLAVIGWKHPSLFGTSTFRSMADLMELLLGVASSGQPMMTKLAVVIANEEHDLVTIWVGKGANSDPYDRITELRGERDALKEELSSAIAELQELRQSTVK